VKFCPRQLTSDFIDPMNAAQALHSAARRYCLDRHHHWCEVYSTVPNQGRAADGYHYSPKALDTFPRYNMLNAIRVAVETIDSDVLIDFATAKSQLLQAGRAADDAFTRSPGDDIAVRAQLDERENFCGFVAAISELDSWNYEPLPYRRVLASDEAARIWSALKSKWGMERRSYWYPLTEASVSGVVAFHTHEFEAAVPAPALVRKLSTMGIERVWELREHGPEFVEDVELFDPQCTGAEGVWTSEGFDWVLYASHESSVTIAGKLLPVVQSMWPEWQLHRWQLHRR
jgi:hypothetical protein